MATSFDVINQVDLPASNTNLYTSPASTLTQILSCYYSNKSAAQITINVDIVRAGGSPILNLLTNAPIPIGGSLDIVANKPIILKANDILRSKASVAASSDVIGSIMQIS